MMHRIQRLISPIHAQHQKRGLGSLLLCGVLLFGNGACETSTVSEDEYQSFSELTQAERMTLRETISTFNDSEFETVNVLRVFDLITEEIVALYPVSTAVGDFSLSNGALELTELFGGGNPGGKGSGFQEFEEEVWTQSGSLSSTGTVGKQSKEFTAGAIVNFDYRSIDLTENVLKTAEDRLRRFTISEEANLEETVWHQQEGFTEGISVPNGGRVYAPYGQTFGYQSQRTMRVQVQPDSKTQHQRVAREEILSKGGWFQETTDERHDDIRGFLTLYQPTDENLEANENPLGLDESVTVTGSVEETSRTETTSWDSSLAMGATFGLIETKEGRVTTILNRQVDRVTGALIAQDEEIYTSVRVSYSQAENGSGYIESELFEDYRDTVKELISTAVEYGAEIPDVMSCEETSDCPWAGFECSQGYGTEKNCLPEVGASICSPWQVSYGISTGGDEMCQNPTKKVVGKRVLRTTDNPRTRHQIADWKSTEEEIVSSYEEDETGVLVEFATTSGLQWLTERIVEDPDYSQIGFAYRSSSKDIHRERLVVFGADLQSQQKTVEESGTLNMEAGWGELSVGVVGSHSFAGASIDTGEGEGFEVGSDSQGLYTVTLEDVETPLTSEEWLNTIWIASTYTAMPGIDSGEEDSEPVPREEE